MNFICIKIYYSYSAEIIYVCIFELQRFDAIHEKNFIKDQYYFWENIKL